MRQVMKKKIQEHPVRASLIGAGTTGLLSFSSPEQDTFSDRDRLLFENIGLLCQDVMLALAYRRMIQFRG